MTNNSYHNKIMQHNTWTKKAQNGQQNFAQVMKRDTKNIKKKTLSPLLVQDS